MNDGRRLVVVDGVPETTQVLRAVFEPRGHRVDRVRAFEVAPDSDDDDSVLVWHAEAAPLQNGTVGQDAGGPAPGGRVRRVIIGSLTAANPSRARGGSHELAQPFHYAELIRAVETLLAEQTAPEAA